MSEVDDFLAETLPRLLRAEEAMHNGDPEPRLEMWSQNDPVSLLGAIGMVETGWDDLSKTFRWVASAFSNCTEYRFELVAAGASGDLGYTVGYEHSTASRNGGPATPNTLRVTHVFRREDGEWRIVHRHGDGLSPESDPRKD